MESGPGGIIHADYGPAHLPGKINGTDFFQSVIFSKGACHSHIVLSKSNHRPSVHHAVAADHPFRRNLSLIHAEIRGAVLGENTNLAEGALVKEIVYPLPGRPLPALVAPLDSLRTSHSLDFLPFLLVFLDKFFSRCHFKPPWTIFTSRTIITIPFPGTTSLDTHLRCHSSTQPPLPALCSTEGHGRWCSRWHRESGEPEYLPDR